MTATNHALTGAALAMLIKRPELAIPAAFLSHFVLDSIPHYNPPNMTRDKFRNFSDSYRSKFNDKFFRIIFPTDMILFLATLVIMPLLAPSQVSPITIFFSALAAASPDFDGGLRFLLRRFGVMKRKPKDDHLFNRFHRWFQWSERPWGICIELVWLAFIVWSLDKLIR